MQFSLHVQIPTELKCSQIALTLLIIKFKSKRKNLCYGNKRSICFFAVFRFGCINFRLLPTETLGRVTHAAHKVLRTHTHTLHCRYSLLATLPMLNSSTDSCLLQCFLVNRSLWMQIPVTISLYTVRRVLSCTQIRNSVSVRVAYAECSVSKNSMK